MGLQPLGLRNVARRRGGDVGLQDEERHGRRPRGCRAGYAFDRVLVFGKVGVAWAHYAFTETVRGYGNYTDTGSGDYSGLLLGLGLEYAIDLHWSVKGEYDYVDYGGKAIPLYTVGGGYDYTANIRNIENIVKAAVNFRLRRSHIRRDPIVRARSRHTCRAGAAPG